MVIYHIDVLLIDKTGTRPDIIIDITVASTHSANHHSTQPGDMADKAEKTKRDKMATKGIRHDGQPTRKNGCVCSGPVWSVGPQCTRISSGVVKR